MCAKYLACVVGLVFGALGVFVYSVEVFATHENDHRFFVEGHITDSNGHGISNAKVFVRAEVLESGVTAFSDQSGAYSALLHLHDVDAGKAITVVAFGMTEHITADFDPQDKETERKAIVNFVHAVSSAKDSNPAFASRAYLIWGIVVLVIGILFGVVSRKLARRRKT